MARRRSDKWKEKIGKGVSKKTPELIEKLRQAFGHGLSVEDGCVYAGIAKQTYYNWIEKDSELLDELELVRLNPILTASKTVIKSLDDPNHAFRYLSVKRPDEYSGKTVIKHEGKIESGEVAVKEGVDKAVKSFNETLREVLTKKKV